MRALIIAGTLLLTLAALEVLVWLTTPGMVPDTHTLASILTMVSNGALAGPLTFLATAVLLGGHAYAVPMGSPMPALESIVLATALILGLPHLVGLPLGTGACVLFLMTLWAASASLRWGMAAVGVTLATVAGLILLPLWALPPVRTRLSRLLGPKLSAHAESLVFVLLIFLTLPLQPVLLLLLGIPYTRHVVDRWRQRWML